MSAEDASKGRSFRIAAPEEETELRALTNALRMGEGFRLLFVQCNQADQRRRLMAQVQKRLPDKRIQELDFTRQELRHLLDTLREAMEAPIPDALFVTGLEFSLPEADTAHRTPFVANLNAARNSFGKYVSCPLVLWIPEYIVVAISRGAPDFFSVRSGLYYFESERTAAATIGAPETFTAAELSPMAGTAYKEKEERIARLQDLLETSREQKEVATEARLLASLGEMQLLLGRYAAAKSLLEAARSTHERMEAPRPEDRIAVLRNLALTLYKQRRYREAERLYQESLAILQRTANGNPLIAIGLFDDLASLYSRQMRFTEAENYFSSAQSALDREEHRETPEWASVLNDLAVLRRRQKRYREAEDLYLQSIEIKKRLWGEEHPSLATSMANLGHLYFLIGRYAESERLYQQALAIKEKTLGGDHPSVAITLNNFARLLRTTGRREQADAMDARAAKIRAQLAAEYGIQ